MRGTLGTGELLDIARVLESVKNILYFLQGSTGRVSIEADSSMTFEKVVPLDDLLHTNPPLYHFREEISDDALTLL